MLPSLESSNVQRSNVKRFGVKRRLALIVALYLVLAISYSVVTPIGQGADEWAHYWYTQFIAQNKRLPLNPAEREAAGYKSDWPPLYHLCAAAITAWIDTAGPPTFKYRDDPNHIRRQIISAPRSEAILHTEDELFPWQQEILVWHLGRFLSIAFSVGTLLVTYRLALEVFTSSKVAGSREAGERHVSRATRHAPRAISPQTLALAATAFLAFIPRFLFTGMLFNYDSLTLLIVSLFLWLAIRVAKGYHLRWGFFALGGLAGLALLTKYLAALLPLEIILLAFSRGAGAQGTAERGRSGPERPAPGGGDLSFAPLPLRPSAPLLKIGQAALAFLLVTSGWFGYLLVNFNEIETYGPILGTVAPLLRGDGSDRTVEQIFAWVSGGQAPSPAHIDQQHYSAGQIIAELPLTFWSVPITRPSSLNWFVGLMTFIFIVGIVGLFIWWRSAPASSPPRFLASLLLLHCLLPLPFMAIRLFGARDALEAVQGRHILFLAGPAIAILLVWGLQVVGSRGAEAAKRRGDEEARRRGEQTINATPHASRLTCHVSRVTFQTLLGLLLTGSLLQLLAMGQGYPLPLPVRTTPLLIAKEATIPPLLALPGGASVVTATVTNSDRGYWFSGLFASSPPTALRVTLFWQGGAEPAPEDYQVELALVDAQGVTRSSWLAYQTQAHYPTRVWEAGDTIRDEGYLPLERLESGDYAVRLRILGEAGPVADWQTLSTYTVNESVSQPINKAVGWVLWQNGQMTSNIPTFQERETAQFTFPTFHAGRSLPAVVGSPPSPLHLISPEHTSYPPASAGETWANFIIGPDWPPGDYRWQADGQVVLRVEPNERNFQLPVLTQPLEANFAGQMKLLGYELPTRRVQPGDGLPITLYWQGLRWMGEDFVIFERLLDNQGIAWGGYDRRAKENYSTLFWAPGEIITDGFALPVDAAAPAGIYTVNLGWYRRAGEKADSLAILDPVTGEPTGSTALTIGPLKVGGPPAGVTVAAANPQHELDVILGEQIKLLGFDLASQQVSQAASGGTLSPSFLARSASPLQLTLYWQALTTLTTDYTVFAHLRPATGETVAQKDSPPANGRYPTSLWDASEIIKDELSVPLEQVAAGQYELVVGLYDFKTGARLPVVGSPDGAVSLGSVEVVE